MGDVTVLVAEGGVPEVEYALFDPGEIELQASGPGNVREVAYQTRVGDARARLEDRGVTAALADEAARAAKPVVARAYARSAAVRTVVDRLGSAELFDGYLFDAAAGTYAGAWLNLVALAADVALPDARALMQAFFLASLLGEHGADEPVILATAEVTAHRRPGERTFKRVSLEEPHALAAALQGLEPRTARAGDPPPHPDLGWAVLVERLRARAAHRSDPDPRLEALQALMTERELPAKGPLADVELWAIEQKLSHGEIFEAPERLDDVERRRGRLPGTIYLRARVALMTQSEEPRAIAERMSELSTSMPAFHELELLAAQALVRRRRRATSKGVRA